MKSWSSLADMALTGLQSELARRWQLRRSLLFIGSLGVSHDSDQPISFQKLSWSEWCARILKYDNKGYILKQLQLYIPKFCEFKTHNMKRKSWTQIPILIKRRREICFRHECMNTMQTNFLTPRNLSLSEWRKHFRIDSGFSSVSAP